MIPVTTSGVSWADLSSIGGIVLTIVGLGLSISGAKTTKDLSEQLGKVNGMAERLESNIQRLEKGVLGQVLHQHNSFIDIMLKKFASEDSTGTSSPEATDKSDESDKP